MRNKAPLALMELLIMLFVFALAAALCLQAFSLSNRISAKNEARDHAVVQAQNAAELFQYYEGDGRSAASDHGGSWDGSTWRIHFDRQWNMVPSDGTYCLQVSVTESGHDLLDSASVTVTESDADGECLITLPVCWQKKE